MKGLFAWIGFPSKPMFYRRDARVAGKTKWNYWNLLGLAIEEIISFSIAPLKVAGYFGMLIAVLALIYATVVIWKTLMTVTRFKVIRRLWWWCFFWEGCN